MLPRFLIMLSGATMTMVSCIHGTTDNSLPVDSSLLQPGDLVLRRGTSLASQAVLMADSAGTYSHIGIVVRHNGQWMVVHAVPGEREDSGTDTVKADRLSDFFLPVRAAHGAVARVHASPATRQRAASEAIAVLARHTPFDHHYDLSDTVALYCTEMVLRCYATAGINLAPAQLRQIDIPGFEGDYAFPSQVLDNPNVTIILNY